MGLLVIYFGSKDADKSLTSVKRLEIIGFCESGKIQSHITNREDRNKF